MHDLKCPHCNEEINIAEHELYYLYEEGTHEVDCPSCKTTILVQVEASYTFEVVEQEN